MVSDSLSPPLPHTLLIRGTMEKWPFQHYNMPHSLSAVQQAMCSVRAGKLTERFMAALSSRALKREKFKASFHLLSLWNASSLDYKWQPHLHVKVEETCEITCPLWAMLEEGKMPSLTTTVQTWGIDQRLCLEIKMSPGQEGEYGIQGTDPQQLI